MPYANHLRLTIRGVLGSVAAPLEEFSYGLNMSDPEGNPFSESELDDIVADVTAFHGNGLSRIWSGAIVTEIKVAAIGPDGRYRRDSQIREVNIPGASPGSAPAMPFQVALAVSLGTGQRGPTKRGRFYLPTPVVGLGTGGLMSQTNAEEIRGSVVTFINNLNNWPGIEANEPKVTVASSKGYNTDVTEVRVGRALDTIRTRRRQLPETYTDALAVA